MSKTDGSCGGSDEEDDEDDDDSEDGSTHKDERGADNRVEFDCVRFFGTSNKL